MFGGKSVLPRSGGGGGGRFAPKWCGIVIWQLTLTSIIAHIN